MVIGASPTLTREDEDEECADSSNDADDLADVRYKHCNEHRHGDPQDRQHIAATALKPLCNQTVTMTTPAQHGVLDH